MPVLTKLGGLLVEETPPAPADLVAVFDNGVPAAAAAADLLAAGYAPRILLFRPPPGADEKLLDRLGIPAPSRHELAILVLHRLGVASEAIVVEPSREVIMESIRWVNSLLLGDLWQE